MPLMTLNRNYVLATTKGHTLAFRAGEPAYVPPSVYLDAVAIGAVAADGAAPAIVDPDVPHIPSAPAERDPLIDKAILALVARNDREDFNAAGTPTVVSVSEQVGFKIQAKEIALRWQAYHDKKAEQ